MKTLNHSKLKLLFFLISLNFLSCGPSDGIVKVNEGPSNESLDSLNSSKNVIKPSTKTISAEADAKAAQTAAEAEATKAKAAQIAAEAESAKAKAAQVEAEAETAKALAAQMKAEAETAEAKAAQMEAEAGLLESMNASKEQIDAAMAEVAAAKAIADAAKAEADAAKAEAEAAKAEADAAKAQADAAKAEADAAKAEADAAKAEAEAAKAEAEAAKAAAKAAELVLNEDINLFRFSLHHFIKNYSLDQIVIAINNSPDLSFRIECAEQTGDVREIYRKHSAYQVRMAQAVTGFDRCQLFMSGGAYEPLDLYDESQALVEIIVPNNNDSHAEEFKLLQ